MAQCRGIVICFQISIFELQKTADDMRNVEQTSCDLLSN